MDYPKSTPNVGLVGGKFVDENTSTGQAGSLIPATWGNSVTDELLGVIVAAGLTPSENDLTQLQKAIQSLAASDVKRTVRVATTGAIALSGVQTIDGVALAAGNRVLVKDQAAASQNGIYTVAAGAWVRALDANESAECVPGHLVIVESGTAHGGAIWQLSNTTLPTLGTSALVYTRVYGKTGVAAGTYRSVTVDLQGRILDGSNPTTVAGYGITDVYTQTQVNNLLAGKAGNATTLAGYGITDAYTQSQVNTLLAAKAPLASPVFTGTPTVPTAAAGTNTLQAASTAFVQAAIAALVGSSPAALDTLKELADAIGNDPNFATTMLNALADKASKATTLAGYGITDGFGGNWSASDYNALSVSGMYQLGSGATANRPAGWSGSQALHMDYGSYAGTLAFSLSADEIAFRRKSPGGYSEWKSLAFRASSLAGYAITDAYTKTETNNAIGSALNSYGIGVQNVSSEVNLNNYYIAGKYVTPSSGLLNLPPGWAQGRHTVDVTGGLNYCTQLITGAGANKGRLAIRVYDGVGWTVQEFTPLGVGQTWQDVTASRAFDTTYTNTTGRPIQVSINTRDPSTGNLAASLFVNGVKIAYYYMSSGSQSTLTAVIPPDATYKLTRDDTNDVIMVWAELR